MPKVSLYPVSQCATLCLVLVCGAARPMWAQPSRIPAVENARRTVLTGHVSPRVAAAEDQGALDASTPMTGVTITLAPTAEQQAELDALLVRQQTPGSPDYHRWLTPAQYAERFGVSESDLGTMRAWLESQGLTVTAVAKSRTWIAVSGSAGQMAKAFQTDLRRYTLNGKAHFANATAPSIPERFAGVVRSVRGLNDFRPQPRKGIVKGRYTSSRTGNHYLAPQDLATIYNFTPLFSAGVDGSGQRVVIAGQSRIQLSDVQTFRSDYGLPASDPEVVFVPGSRDPGLSDGDVDESHLDIEWSGSAAPGAKIVYVYAWDVFDAVQYAIDQNLATVISTSYGLCEPELTTAEAQTYRTWAQQANAQGITWFSASGDTGAADCAYINVSGTAVDFPAAIPEVTAVGGTTFVEGSGDYWNTTNTTTYGSAKGYIPETAWNDSVEDGEPSATGGGLSRFFARPTWQTGAGVSGDSARHVPDVAMSASGDHDGYIVRTLGEEYIFGGTSVPTPIYAGVAALLNQAAGTGGLGNINPTLYALAQTRPAVFHDVTTGDNTVTVTCPSRGRNCTAGTVSGYSAGAGYDMATGLGSVDVYQLASAWTGGTPRAPSATVELTLQSNLAQVASAQSVFLTAMAKGNDGSTPSGTVVFTQGQNTLGSAELKGSGGAATATLAVSGAMLAQGSGSLGATLNGAQSATITVAVSATAGTTGGVPSVSGAVNAASYRAAFAPGEIVAVFGSQMAGTTDVVTTAPLPVTFDGVAATVNGIAAPIWSIAPGQINLQIPYQVAAGPATLVVNNNGQTASFALSVAATAPGIFEPVAAGARGGYLTLYVTGVGAVSPEVANGAAPAAGFSLTPMAAPSVTIGGAPATVTYAGIPAGFVGVMQVNVQVPATVAAGTQPVVVTMGGVASAAASVQVQ
jgi:uncharacterized protein (TIGR03437 family)